MKRWLVVVSLVALPLAAFAQMGPDHPGFPRLDWKAGTTVTASYQELTGTVVLGERVAPVLKVKDTEYILMVKPHDPSALVLKNGATVAFKGVATKVVEAGQADKYMYRPFEATIDGQTVKFEKSFRQGPWQADGPQRPMQPQQN